MPTLRQLQYLVAIAETQSFRRAAERCHVSQPTLSDQIGVLEQRLRVQLLERSRRRVVLTSIGRQIADRARKVLRDVQDIRDLAERGRHVLDGTLRCGILPSLGPYLLPLVLPHLQSRHPRLTLYLREDAGAELLRRLEDGDLDLLVLDLPVRDAGVSVDPLFDEPLWLAMATGHPLAAKPEIEPEDLRGQDVLALESPHSLHDRLLALCRACGARPLLEFATTSLDTLRQMAGMGVGVTFLPALYVRAEVLQDARIAVRPLASPEAMRRIALAWRSLSARGEEYAVLAAGVREALRAAAPELSIAPESPAQRSEEGSEENRAAGRPDGTATD